MLDQALSSLANVALGIVVARQVTIENLGYFSLGFSFYLLAVGVLRALTSEPLSVLLAAELHTGAFRRNAQSVLAVGVAFGTIYGLLLLVGGLAAGGELRQCLWWLGALIAPLLLQDTCRSVAFVKATPRVAAMNDFAWVVMQFMAVALLIRQANASPSAYLAVWAASGAIAGLMGLIQLRMIPLFGSIGDWLKVSIDLWPRFVAEAVVSNGARQSVLWMAALFAGAAGAGALRGAQLLMGPVRVVLMALMSAGVAEGVRAAGNDAARLSKYVWRAAGMLGLASTAWVGALLLVPDFLGKELLGGSWIDAEELLLPVGVYWIGTALITGLTVGLRVLADAKASLLARTVEVTSLVLLATGGGVLAGPLGIAWGMGGGAIIGFFVWATLFKKSSRQFLRTQVMSAGPLADAR
jgi:hypothetical protein